MNVKILLATSKGERAKNYIEALKAVGVGADDILPIFPNGPQTESLVGEAAGLVLCGGEDVAPHRYGEGELENSGLYVFPERDVLEWSLLDAARAASLPVFGVCRGLQVLNVYFGGTLWQDLPSQRRTVLRHSINTPLDQIAHAVSGAGGDHPHPFARRLAAALAQDPSVNSRHHQAVKDLAPGLEVAGTAPDGLIEAFVRRDPEEWWVGAVQWHPENLIQREAQRELWSAFVERTHANGPG